jgi:homoserine kinase
VRRRRVVRVPASSANLGPGFDSFAAALSLHLELEVVESGRFAVRTELPVARGRRNLCVRAFERLHPADGFTFNIRSQIPLAGGLGSSGAAIVAGLLAAADLFELDEDIRAHACALEGHPDNVTASLKGGFVVCAGDVVAHVAAPAGLEALAVVPRQEQEAGARQITTKRARAVLPRKVPLADAVFNTAHGALLALGLASCDLGLIAAGLDDRLHQQRRAQLFPRSAELIARARELGALGATLSGAGPTVLVWCHYEQTGPVLEHLREAVAGWADVMRVPFEAQGAYVAEL